MDIIAWHPLRTVQTDRLVVGANTRNAFAIHLLEDYLISGSYYPAWLSDWVSEVTQTKYVMDWLISILSLVDTKSILLLMSYYIRDIVIIVIIIDDH